MCNSSLDKIRKMSSYRYALVSWTNGPDKDAISIVPTKWIIDFDPTDTSRTYLVECRMTKRPVNGWQVEHAVVLKLAEKESTLKSAERELFKEDIPKDHKRSSKPNRQFCDEDDASNCEIPKKKKTKLAARRQAEENIISENNQLTPEIQSPAEGSSNENAEQIRDLQNQVKALQKENTRLRHMVVKEIPSLLVDIKKVLANSNPTKDVTVCEDENEGETTSCTPSEVKLGKDGTTLSSLLGDCKIPTYSQWDGTSAAVGPL
ncbi:uncharacterized protein LOC143488872 [Brachyhypopomus gauderio]|uniref:uncharacterized protein LOC143488872 n=1 Tax=Brachyhypopomus gauderio TaxID=698409 RepID=UPI00404368B0